MRSIIHPGTPSTFKICSVNAGVESADIVLQAGANLLSAMIAALEPFDTQSAVLRLEGGAFEPFCYVMPALSRNQEHSVYFSDRYDVAGRVVLETASVTYGLRDGAPWLHCHAVWIEPDGTRRCGHLLPEDIRISQPVRAHVSILRGVAFTVKADAETNFSLFVPEQARLKAPSPSPIMADTSPVQTAFAIRLSPNVDVCSAIESFCSEHHITRATILGGVGSTVGAVFDDNRIVEPFVTEMLIRQGCIQPDEQGLPQALIDISMVDYEGGISEGRLKRGENPVLVTFELVVQPH